MSHHNHHRDTYTDGIPILSKSGKCVLLDGVTCILDKIEAFTAQQVSTIPGPLDLFYPRPAPTYRLCLHMISGNRIYGKECSAEEVRKYKLQVGGWITGYSATAEATATPLGPEPKPETETPQ